jgi:hypothetical protein
MKMGTGMIPVPRGDASAEHREENREGKKGEGLRNEPTELPAHWFHTGNTQPSMLVV